MDTHDKKGMEIVKGYKHERTLFLDSGEFGEEKLVKVRIGSIIQFKLSPNLHGHKVELYTNYISLLPFDRKTYYAINFGDRRYDENTSMIIRVQKPGAFHYYITVDDAKESCGGGYFIVDPSVIYKHKDVSLSSISMITYMTKCLGRFADWESRLEVARQSGFNYIHFTPVQSLGKSGSGYSILDQLQINPDFGDNMCWNMIKQLITKLQNEWQVLSLCDIVLNHTSNETPWLKEHPEAAYNLQNCPHLLPAYLLDRLFQKISLEVANDEWGKRGVPSAINSEDHLNSLRVLLHEKIRELRLEEFYLINVADCRLEPAAGDCGDEVVHTYSRFGSKVGGHTPRWKVEKLNEEARSIINNHINAAVENVISGIRYERIQSDGPKYEKVTVDKPLTHRYFEEVNGLSETDTKEILLSIDPLEAPYIMAHNGWVMNDAPLRNFADESSNVYLRRELIAWSDSIKLRYGNRIEDSPFLWGYMTKYAKLLAQHFHGLRLDNCHSTPLHVAEYLIDKARLVRSDLLVVAELFTNSDSKDNVFVNHLGINLLIREAQQAWNCHEQGRLLYQYGGKPVGAFEKTAPPAVAGALLFDQTHDNPSHIQKRSFKDILPTAAMVSFGACAIGSVRGFDDVVPHQIDVVHEKRFYPKYAFRSTCPAEVNFVNRMFLTRLFLNRNHFFLGNRGYSETYIDQMEDNVVAVTRSNPVTRESMILIVYTAFNLPEEGFHRLPNTIRPLTVDTEITKVVFEGRLVQTGEPFTPHDTYLLGIDCEREWREHLTYEYSEFVHVVKSQRSSRIEFVNFQPGDVIAFKAAPFESTTIALRDLSGLLESNELNLIIEKLELVTLNYVLYRCKEEEGSIYSIPNYGDLIYAGLQGVASVIENVALSNDLGHPICKNLRDGLWLMEYIHHRLIINTETVELGHYFGKLLNNIKELPSYLVPTYFEQCFTKIYRLCLARALKLMGATDDSGELQKMLMLTSVQFVGVANGGSLPAGGNEISYFDDNGNKFISYSLCAGLPHFSTGYMRNWGRDTFIALPGLLLLTKRYDEAKQHILSYASVLRHGLIPNLMNEGNCRYNCRDATWWWLYSIVKYMELVPDGIKILFEDVMLDGKLFRLQDVVHLAIEAHCNGIHFREENAGPQIDACMTDAGFNIDIHTDGETGFIYGGNAYNCGTWMDKMGSSDIGKNKGIPATPRDGAAVEIIGLAAAVLKVFGNLKGYEYRYMTNPKGLVWSYEEWYDLIREHFEDHFYVSSDSEDELVNVRNIYKDTVGASNKFGDFQLRPNFLIAMVVCPELFSKERAITALGIVKEKLISKLGVKTLDESDWNYNGYYDNLDSSDPKTANGFNYHQGPEWVWPMGFYLRALLEFSGKDAIPEIRKILSKHYRHLKLSLNPWRSLPEVTNKDGETCSASCPAQAWSCGTLLEVLHDLEKIDIPEEEPPETRGQTRVVRHE